MRVPPTLERPGGAGIAAAAIALATALVHLVVVEPRAERAHAARGAANDPGPREAAELVRFRAVFPAASEPAAQLEALLGHARAAGVRAVRGEYRLEPAPGGLAAYRVQLSARASYAQLRRFVAAALDELPGVSLDAMRLERRAASDALLDAELRFTIYLRADGEA